MRRSMGRRGNPGNTARGGGPLMTGHLKDIDLELELLKRKREMIEQQQQLLVMEQQFKSSRKYESYDQMRYDKPVQHGSNRDFTQLYDNEPKNRNQFGRKRQPEVQWQYENSFKRIQTKRKNNPPQSNQHGPGNANNRNQRPVPSPSQGPKSSPRRPTPLMGVKIKPSIGQRITNQKPPSKTPNKDFTLTKSLKSKAPPAPNKLASQPLAERKSLVAAAKESGSDVSRMLLPDRVPSQQVSGRLELALGAIMKNIRELIPTQHSTELRTVPLQRVMKQAIRERIRTVMLGKVVGSLLDILAVYREEFPEETDIDIVNIALEAGGISGVQAPPAKKQEDKPKLLVPVAAEAESFKRQLHNHLRSQLHEMFDKLQEMYNSAPAEPAGNNDTLAEPGSNSETLAEPAGNSETSAEPAAEPAANSETPVEPAANCETPAEPAANSETPVEPAANSETSAELSANSETPAEPTANSETPAEPTANSETPAEPTANSETAAETAAANIETPKEQRDPEKVGEIKKVHEEISEMQVFLNSDIKVRDVKRILPRLMKRCIPYIIKLMDAAPFKYSALEAHKMQDNLPRDGQGDGNIVAASAVTSGPRQAYNLPYYVKIMGRPSLPKRKVMQAFLTKFNPKSVKKHRTIHNLLFVGFTEQTDYDAMVAANGTVIGRFALSVRDCSKGAQESTNGQNGANNEADNETNFAMDINPDEIKKDVVIISDDLDGQITDLLSSIKKSEEEELKETGEKIDNNSIDVEMEAVTEQNESDENKIEKGNDNAEAAEDDKDETTGDENNASEEKEVPDEDEKSEVDNEPETQNPGANTENADVTVTNDGDNQKDSHPSSKGNSVKAEEQPEDGKVGDLKGNTSGTATPARTSARLASVTPSTVRTRRASRLAQN